MHAIVYWTCLKVIGSKKWKVTMWGSISVAVGSWMFLLTGWVCNSQKEVGGKALFTG